MAKLLRPRRDARAIGDQYATSAREHDTGERRDAGVGTAAIALCGSLAGSWVGDEANSQRLKLFLDFHSFDPIALLFGQFQNCQRAAPITNIDRDFLAGFDGLQKAADVAFAFTALNLNRLAD